MGWVRISDDFYDHPAHAVLGLEEWGLWVWSLAWSNRNLTDGVIPWPVVKRMDPDGDATGALLEAGRWVDCDEGNVVIHDYLDWQPSAEQVRGKREKERERWQRRAGSTDSPDTPSDPSAATPRGADPDSAQTPPASQPQPQLSPNGERAARSKGTRMTDPFPVDEQMQEWVERECRGLDWVAETRKFADHFRAVSGAKGVKLDWPATWRNWMRRASEGAFR